MKRRLFKIVVLVLLSACRPNASRDPLRLVYCIRAEPANLNPITYTDSASFTVISLIYDSLLERDGDTLEWKPLLADRWEVSDDHLTYTFHLRSDAYWHDGVQITADDVVFTFNTIMNPAVDAASKRAYYKDVASVEKVDDSTIRFTYKYPYYQALSVLASIRPIPKHIFEGAKDFGSAASARSGIIGSGPFVFVKWETGEQILLKRNENYFNGRVGLKEISFRIVPDGRTAMRLLKKGEIDLMELSPTEWMRQTNSARFLSHFDKYKYYMPAIIYIGWNNKNRLFADARVRRALTMLIDREKIKERLYFGLAESVISDVYKYLPEYNTSIKPYPYDPNGAALLLGEAGWRDTDGDGLLDKDGVPFRFTLMVPTSKTADNISNILREDFKKVGIEMDVVRFEWAVYLKNLSDSAFDAVFGGWTLSLDPDPYQIWHSSQAKGGSNYIQFSNPAADEIITRIRTEFDKEKRRELLWRFQEIIHEEEPYTFLYMPATLVAIDKRFTNVHISKLGIDIRRLEVANEK